MAFESPKYPMRQMKEGDTHPAWPWWSVAKHAHSETHPDLVSYGWVRLDGKRGPWMGYRAQWGARSGLPLQGGFASEVGPDLDLHCIDRDYPLARGLRENALAEIAAERERQDAKWGEQNHPDADPVLLARPRAHDTLARDIEIPTADRAKELCQHAASTGRTHWSAILQEEVSEAVDAIGNDDVLRKELVQVAAVAAQWVEAIDRRRLAAIIAARQAAEIEAETSTSRSA